jgi:hypothetical protein
MKRKDFDIEFQHSFTAWCHVFFKLCRFEQHQKVNDFFKDIKLQQSLK